MRDKESVKMFSFSFCFTFYSYRIFKYKIDFNIVWVIHMLNS